VAEIATEPPRISFNGGMVVPSLMDNLPRSLLPLCLYSFEALLFCFISLPYGVFEAGQGILKTLKGKKENENFTKKESYLSNES
jgi:hypothetical protein